MAATPETSGGATGGPPGEGEGAGSALRAEVAAWPKAELHVHLEGSITPALAVSLAARHGLSLPGLDGGVEGVTRAFEFTDLGGFISAFLAASDCLRRAEDFAAAVTDLAARQAAEGVVAAELTVTAATHLTRGVSEQALLDGLAQGRREALERHGVHVGYVFDVVCIFPEQSDLTVDVALRGREAAWWAWGSRDPRDARHPCLRSRRRSSAPSRAAAVCRAGEHGDAARVREAVERQARIGHGVRCLEDPSVVALLRDRGVVLEVCPTSNVRLGVAPSLAAHPLPRLLDAGLEVAVASDDPALLGTSAAEELARCVESMGLTRQQVASLSAASLRALCEGTGASAATYEAVSRERD